MKVEKIVILQSIQRTDKFLISYITKHLTLLLFIGLAWGQENPDTLTYYNSPKFPGRFLGITFGGFEFEMIDKSVIKKTSINDTQELSINSLIVIHNGQWVVEKEYIKNYGRDINYLHYDNYQHDYQQGVTAAKKDWADSKRFYGILSPTYESLQLKEKNQILVTDSQAPVPGFRDGYRKEMAKFKFTQRVTRMGLVGCGCLGMWSWFYTQF